LQGNPYNEKRIPAMRTGFPVMKTANSVIDFKKTIHLQNFTARMIWIVTTKENAIMEYAYVSLDGKNKQIVQVYNCEKDN
jgi:hypothetical protein